MVDWLTLYLSRTAHLSAACLTRMLNSICLWEWSAVWELFIGLGVVLWCGNVILLALLGRGLPRLSREDAAQPESWPKISVVVAACNEAGTIANALQQLRKQDYPDFEIIVVNDRSTDETEAIVAELAKSDPRIRLQTVTELPDGWLGKVHALHKGVEAALGEWIVFADADVHFDSGLFKKAISVALQDRLVHLSVLPDLSSRSLLPAVWLPAPFEELRCRRSLGLPMTLTIPRQLRRCI